MDFEICKLDLDDPSVWQHALELLKRTYSDPDIERQLRHNTLDAPKGTVFFGAFHGERLVGINGFVRHSIVYRNQEMGAFQSCSTATDPDYRGRGIFSKIIKHAQAALASECLFLCGFPNEMSEPIFTGALGFRKIPLIKIIVPAASLTSIAFWPISALSKFLSLGQHDQRIYFNQNELIEWKRKPTGRPVSIWHYSGTAIWGVDVKKKIEGFNIRMYSVGGIDLIGARSATPCAYETKPHQPPLYYTIVTTCDSAILSAMRFCSVRRPSGTFIYYPMPLLDTEGPRFEVFCGLADFY